MAVKLPQAGDSASADDLAGFRHEAAVLARLDHPNRIRLYEAGVAAGRPSLAPEYVVGPTPADAGVVGAVARAAHHAHQEGGGSPRHQAVQRAAIRRRAEVD
jgi:hypothetical protein